MWRRRARITPARTRELLAWFPDEAACLDYLEWLRWPDGFPLPRCVQSGWLATEQWSLGVFGVRASAVGHGGNDLSPHSDAAAVVVRGGVGDDQPEARCLGAGDFSGRWGWGHIRRRGRCCTVTARRWCVPAASDWPAWSRSTRRIWVGLKAGCSAGRPTPRRSSRSRLRSSSPGDSGGFDCNASTTSPQDSLIPFIENAVEPERPSTPTDGRPTGRVPEHGYEHERTIMRGKHDPAHVVMPGVHRVASLLKRWLLGTHQGSVGPEHLDAYLNEFTFRVQPTPLPASRPALLPRCSSKRSSPTRSPTAA